MIHPEPGIYGSTNDDVNFIAPLMGRKVKRTRSSTEPQILSDVSASCRPACHYMKTNLRWQKIRTFYKDHVAIEATKKEKFLKFKADFQALEKLDQSVSDDPALKIIFLKVFPISLRVTHSFPRRALSSIQGL
jgi:hypothetical protein